MEQQSSVADALAIQLPLDSADAVVQLPDGSLRWTNEARSLIDGLAAEYHVVGGDEAVFVEGFRDQGVLTPGVGEPTLQQWAKKQTDIGYTVLLGVGVPLSTVDTDPEFGVASWRWMAVVASVKSDEKLPAASRGVGDQRFPIYAEPSFAQRLGKVVVSDVASLLMIVAVLGLGIRRVIR